MKFISQRIVSTILYLSACAAMSADEINITSTNDSGAGTLRDAMTIAQDGDILIFDTNLSGTITLASSLPSITASYSIVGPRIGSVTIDGSSTYQIFQVDAGFPDISLLTLINGTNANDGGCLFVSGSASLSVEDTFVNHCNGTCTAPVYVGVDAYLSASNLIFNSGSSTSGKGIYLDSTAALDYSCDSSVVSTYMIDGGGNFLKWGDGTATVGTLSSTDIIFVAQEGTLVLDVQTVEPVISNLNGTLIGDADVYYLVNNGILEPGLGVGTMHSNADYYQTSNGTLFVDITASGANDYLQIDGDAFIDGNIIVNPLAGSYTTGTKYTFMSTGGFVNGTFGSVTCTDNNVSVTINYYSQSIEIEIL